MSKASDVLDKIVIQSYPTESNPFAKSIDQASHQLYLDLVGLIGDDEYVNRHWSGKEWYEYNEQMRRNNLRSELRTALAEYFNEPK